MGYRLIDKDSKKTLSQIETSNRAERRKNIKSDERSKTSNHIQNTVFGTTLNVQIGYEILNLGSNGKGENGRLDKPNNLLSLCDSTRVKIWTNNNPLIIHICNIISRKIVSAENNIGFIVNFKLEEKEQKNILDKDEQETTDQAKERENKERRNSTLTSHLNKVFEKQCLSIGNYDRRRVTLKTLLYKIINNVCLNGIGYLRWDSNSQTYIQLKKADIYEVTNQLDREQAFPILLASNNIKDHPIPLFRVGKHNKANDEELAKINALHIIAKGDVFRIEDESDKKKYRDALYYIKLGFLDLKLNNKNKEEIVFAKCFIDKGRVINNSTGLEVGCIFKGNSENMQFVPKDEFFSFSLNTSENEMEHAPVFLYALANIAVYTMLEESVSSRAVIDSRIQAVLSPKESVIPYLGNETESIAGSMARDLGAIYQEIAKNENRNDLGFVVLPTPVDIQQMQSMSKEDFVQYMKDVLAKTGAMFGITYSELTGDGSEVNYNSAMSSQDEAYKTVRVFQESLKCVFSDIIQHILMFKVRPEIKSCENHVLCDLFENYNVDFEIEFKNDITAEVFKLIKQVRENVLNGFVSHETGLIELGKDPSKERANIRKEKKSDALLNAEITQEQLINEVELLSGKSPEFQEMYIKLRGSSGQSIQSQTSKKEITTSQNEFQGGETEKSLEDNEGSYGENT